MKLTDRDIRELVDYIEEMAFAISHTRGSGKSVQEMVDDSEMPAIYYKLKNYQNNNL